MKPETNHFPSMLRSVRTAQGLTQQQLASRIGVSQSSISLWENGSEKPTVEHIILLALELPQIIESFYGDERALLMRILRLERALFAGKCACPGCSCGMEHSASTRARSRGD